jgi:TetR/AcrR family transcriptional regulator
MVRHAIAVEDKQARRAGILDAARALFMSNHGESLPSASQIAAQAGLAKGTVYLYFRTKEEIFIDLLFDACIQTLDHIETTFTHGSGPRRDRIAAFLRSYVDHLHRNPELLLLDAMCHSVLEKNLEALKLEKFKLGFAQRFEQTGRVVEHALRLSSGRGMDLLNRTFAMTRGLWQANRKEQLHAVCDSGSLAPPALLEFSTELSEALTEYWRGAVMSR